MEPSRKRKPRRVDGILKKVMDKLKTQANQQGASLGMVWNAIVGEKVAAHTRPERIQGTRLVVLAENAAWMNELTFLKEKIKIEAKNRFSALGMTVEDVTFRLAHTGGKRSGFSKNVPSSGS